MKATDQKGRIHEVSDNAHGEATSAGHYVIGPDGRLVLQSPAMPLKAGWRVATEDDIDRKEAEEAARANPPPAPSSTPEPT